MTTDKIKKKAVEIARLLDANYEAKCFLEHESPYELMIATILSAQCTDDRVNIITESLFKKYPTLESFANADLSELAQDIRTAGFFNAKAKSILLSSQMLLNEYGGVMPEDINILTKFPGIGRKTANIIRGHVYQIPSIAVDTHVKRLSRLLGLTTNTDPDKIEFDLMAAFPREYWLKCNTQMIAHGRAVCKARKPACELCVLREYCDSFIGSRKNSTSKQADSGHY